MYQLHGLQRPNEWGGKSFSGGWVGHPFSHKFMRLPVYRRKSRPVPLTLNSNAAVGNKFLKPMQLSGLGRMTPEQEAEFKKLRLYLLDQRRMIKAASKGKGKKAYKAALIAAGVSKRDIRQTKKAFKQSIKLGVPTGPTQPGSPVQPGPGNGGVVILEPWNPPTSTGSGGGGGAGGGYALDPTGAGDGSAEPAKGGGFLPIALAAAGLYFLS